MRAPEVEEVRNADGPIDPADRRELLPDDPAAGGAHRDRVAADDADDPETDDPIKGCLIGLAMVAALTAIVVLIAWRV